MGSIEDGLVKQCTQCKQVLPLESFGFKHGGKGTRLAECRVCGAKRKRNYYIAHVEEAREYRRDYHKEHKEEEAAYAVQYREEHREELIQGSKQYHADHWEEDRQRDHDRYHTDIEESRHKAREQQATIGSKATRKEWVERNRDKLQEYCRKSIAKHKGEIQQQRNERNRERREQNPAWHEEQCQKSRERRKEKKAELLALRSPEEVEAEQIAKEELAHQRDEARKQYEREYALRRYREHPEKWREYRTEENREHREALQRAWRERNREHILELDRTRYKEKRACSNRKRRALKRATVYNLTPSDITAILAKGCFFCGSQEDLTIAHDKPVSQGGETTRANCFCLCRSCNSRMGTKRLAEVTRQLSLL